MTVAFFAAKVFIKERFRHESVNPRKPLVGERKFSQSARARVHGQLLIHKFFTLSGFDLDGFASGKGDAYILDIIAAAEGGLVGI